MTADEEPVPLHDSIDGMRWAQEFARLITDEHVRDVGVLVGWFANAIEAGRRSPYPWTCLHCRGQLTHHLGLPSSRDIEDRS